MKKISILLFLTVIALSSFSQRDQYKYKFNVDLTGGVGKHKFIGEEIKDNESPFNFFYSVRARYKVYKNYELEAGFGQSQFGTYVNMSNPIDIERTYNIPVLIRMPLNKYFSVGLGAEFNLLNTAYQSWADEKTDYSMEYNDNFWGPYAEIKVADYNSSFRISYSWGISPARSMPEEWKTGALRFSIGLNIAAYTRVLLLGMY